MEGIGRHLVEVLKKLVVMRPDDQFLLIFDRQPQVDYQIAPHIDIIVAGPPARHPLLYNIWFDWQIPRILKQWRADIFWSPDNFCSLRTNCPTLLTVHDLAYMHYPGHLDRAHQRYYRNRMPGFLNRADRIAAVSEFTARDLLETTQVPANKISVVCNGAETKPASAIDIADFRNLHTAGRPYFVYVGSIHPRKNVTLLVQAYDQYRQNGGSPWPLILVGRSAWKTNDTQQAIEQALFKEDIRLTGYLPDDQTHKWLAAAGALVYVSLFEGFGMPVLEAMQAGVPVITSANSSMSEVGGKAVITVDPKNLTALALAMQTMSKDADQRGICIQKGLLQAKEYSWAKSAAAYSEILTELHNKKAPPFR
jgi:glycosyltransferase involved in cell wall biosynthesis